LYDCFGTHSARSILWLDGKNIIILIIIIFRFSQLLVLVSVAVLLDQNRRDFSGAVFDLLFVGFYCGRV
jgi:hypothetical protein